MKIFFHKYYRAQFRHKLRIIEREVAFELSYRRELEREMRAAAGLAKLKAQQQ